MGNTIKSGNFGEYELDIFVEKIIFVNLKYLKDFRMPDMNESNWKPIGKPVWWIDLVYFLNRSGNEFEVELNDVIKKIKNSYK